MEKEGKTDLCLKFVLVNSTTQIFWANRSKIISVYEMKGTKKAIVIPELSDVSEASLK